MQQQFRTAIYPNVWHMVTWTYTALQFRFLKQQLMWTANAFKADFHNSSLHWHLAAV